VKEHESFPPVLHMLRSTLTRWPYLYSWSDRSSYGPSSRRIRLFSVAGGVDTIVQSRSSRIAYEYLIRSDLPRRNAQGSRTRCVCAPCLFISLLWTRVCLRKITSARQ